MLLEVFLELGVVLDVFLSSFWRHFALLAAFEAPFGAKLGPWGVHFGALAASGGSLRSFLVLLVASGAPAGPKSGICRQLYRFGHFWTKMIVSPRRQRDLGQKHNSVGQIRRSQRHAVVSPW